jgi:hypothetical protein
MFANQTENSIFEVILTPCNESQSMTYCENFVGTIKEILLRSNEIIDGLKVLFPKGDFSIQIEDTKCEQIRFIHLGFVFDDDGKIVGNINDHV